MYALLLGMQEMPLSPLWDHMLVETTFNSADCSLRQGAGGREFARLGSRTWLLQVILMAF